MGHRNSSAQCHDAGCLCLDGGGARGDAAGSYALNAAARDEQTLVKTEIQTADSSLHGRPFRGIADWKEEAPAIPLGMTTVFPSGGGRSLRNVASGTGAGLLLFGIRFYQAIFAHLMPV